MIDDVSTSDTEIWKYVDDTTIAEPWPKTKPASTIQESVNDLVAKSDKNKFQLNESKCKEMRISFAENEAEFAPIVINEKAIEVVTSVNVLGLNISKDLKWNEEGKRRNQGTHNFLHNTHPFGHRVRLFSFSQFTPKLPVEGLQRRAMRIIFPACHLS